MKYMGENLKLQYSDDIYSYYKVNDDFELWGHKIDTNDVEIAISNKVELDGENLRKIESYIDWLKKSQDCLINYFAEKNETALPEDWIKTLEVMSVSITFVNNEDYGATISFGESLYLDHCIEVDYEKEEIIEERLNG